MSVNNVIDRVLATAEQMLRDRYDCEPVVDRDQLTVSGGGATVLLLDPGDTSSRIGIQALRDARETYPDQRLIVVAHGGATPFMNGRMDTEEMRGVEVFTCAQLMFNVTRHALVPRHERLAPEDEARMLASIGAPGRDALPTQLYSDPVARYYDYADGDVVRIDRSDCGDAGLPIQTTGLRVVRRERA